MGSIFSCRLATITGILCVVSGVVPALSLQVAASVLAFQSVPDVSLKARSFGMRNV